MSRTAHRFGALLLPLVLLVVAACSVGPSNRPAVAYRGGEQQVPPAPPTPKPAPVPPLGKPAKETLNWQDCSEQTRQRLGPTSPAGATAFSCAQMATALDSPESPGSGIARISLLGVGSGAVPLVVVNDASGEPGTALAAKLALRMPPEMLSTFRIIGMDRRGTGSSDAAECVPPPQRETIAGFDPKATDPASLNRLLDSVRQSSQRCLLNLDERAQAYDTQRAAGDLEELRVQLGVPKLHAIGRGEAAQLLGTYSEHYPNSVGRMVFDGAPDPALDAMERAKNQAQSAEQTFDAFATDCLHAGPCPLGPDVRGSVGELVERTRRAPLPAPGAPVTAGTIVQATLLGLENPATWPDLVRALDAANHGDGTEIAALVAPLVTGDALQPPRLDGGMITNCNDTTLRVPPQRSTQIANDWVRRFPLFGGKFAQRIVRCGVWPVPQQDPPAPKNPTLPPIPVISTAHDPSMPALGSNHMAQQLPSGVVVNWQGSGHGAMGRSDCITATVSRFLVHGTVPTEGTVCPA